MILFLDRRPSSSVLCPKTKNQVSDDSNEDENLMEFSLCVTCNEETHPPDALGLIKNNNF